ncbi:PREDICTED: uncharacterized protein LOC107173639 [Diuraphis noxia]|uniref:uncharacterized protein LOC107173639 n=1 Tax=Diuraphis noxia TaxID=143948 RepID=UPI000763698E|nr:PREDICTED: uncharacterized protein LOC107173639 [Diuraphis noxia]
MFKFTVTLLITAMAASASLAVSIPVEHRPQEPAADSSNVVMHKKHVKPDKVVFMSEVSASHVGEGGSEDGNEGGNDGGSGLLELGLSGLLEVASAPKKIIGAIASFVFGKLKLLDLKKLVKITMLAALVTVLGAVASVAVAGFVSVVTVVCTVLPYLKFVFGGHHHKGESTSESQIDLVSEFMMGALEKYSNNSNKRKA